MPIYLDLLIILNFLVDFFLLIATNRLSGFPPGIKRAALAAALGGVYSGVCILPGLTFLAGTLWRTVFLTLIAGIAFGFRTEAVRRTVLFLLLSMALGGVAAGLNSGNFFTLILSAGIICLMCLLGFRGKAGSEYVSVEIGDLHLTALRDTGNTLTDPLTGQQVLVTSSRVGQQLLGLTAAELADPLESIKKVRGARLIPYHAVGQKNGMLLARRFENVKIGSWRGNCLVAFAPNELGRGLPYEALTGGTL